MPCYSGAQRLTKFFKSEQLMRDNGVSFKQAENVNAYSFLPKWLHPR